MARPTAPKKPQRGPVFPWYFATRALGTVFLLYGLLADHSGERGTIILTGAGLLGIDKVARSEPKG